jgi:hypothetical protein
MNKNAIMGAVKEHSNLFERSKESCFSMCHIGARSEGLLMDRDEAERIAQAIRVFGEPFVVIGVELNHVSGHYEVRCEYHGKTKQLRRVYLEGNITLLVEGTMPNCGSSALPVLKELSWKIHF